MSNLWNAADQTIDMHQTSELDLFWIEINTEGTHCNIMRYGCDWIELSELLYTTKPPGSRRA